MINVMRSDVEMINPRIAQKWLSLVVLVVDIRQTPLLGGSTHLVTPPDHQTVGHIHRVIARPLQHKPAIGHW